MSSMMKKKTGPGFKPSARPRRPGPAPPQPPKAPSAPPPAPVEPTPPATVTEAADTTAEEIVGESSRPDTDQTPQVAESIAAPTPPSQQAETTTSTTAQRDDGPNGGEDQQQTTTGSSESAPGPSAPPQTTSTTTELPRRRASTARLPTEIPQIISTSTPNVQEPTPASTAAEEQLQPDTATDTATRKTPAKRGRRPSAPSTQEQDATPDNGEDGEDQDGEGEDDVADEDGQAPPAKKRRQYKRKTADEDGAEPAQRKPRKKKETSTEGSEANGDIPQRPRKRKERSPTPDDAEGQLVDRTKLTLKDLTKDLRIGKKFSRHDELVQRERDKLFKKKLGLGGAGTSEDTSRTGTPVPAAAAAAPTPTASVDPEAAPESSAMDSLEPLGPRFIEVDGQIVLDQSSLTLDRHARAQEQALAAGETLVEEEEHEFSRLTTSNSFRTGSKLRGPNLWGEDDTELFYRGLKMFGTDFQLISNMFPGRTRRHVKMKFNREEKHSPARIHRTLVGEKTVKIDIEQYKSWTGVDYTPVEEIMAEHKARQVEHDAEARRQADERTEELRKKREALFADGPAEGGAAGLGPDGADADAHRRKNKKKKKKMDDPRMYGEVVEETLA